MQGPPKQMLGSKLEGTQLREVVRWRGPSPRTRAHREPWLWAEHGLAMATPRRAAESSSSLPSSQGQSSRHRRRVQQRQAAGSDDAAVPQDLVTAAVQAQNPGLSEAQLRRAASYCGCSSRRFAAYLEEFARQDATEAKYDCGWSAHSVVAEHCVEQEELVSTGRYIREDATVRTPNRRGRRKAPPITRGAAEPDASTNRDQEQSDEQEGSALDASVCSGLTELGLLVLGEDGEPESYHSPKHAEGRASQLLPDDVESTPRTSSDSCCDEEESGALRVQQLGLRHDSAGEEQADLESSIEAQPENQDEGDRCNEEIAEHASAALEAGRPTSPIQAYLRLERRPTTSAHLCHDHVQAEVAFAQLRAQLASLKQRPHTVCGRCPPSPPSPLSLATATATALAEAVGCKTKSPTRPETPQEFPSGPQRVTRTNGTAAPLIPSFGGMPASRAVGSYRRGRSGIASPTAGIGGCGGSVDAASGNILGTGGDTGSGSPSDGTQMQAMEQATNSSKAFVASLTKKDPSRLQGNIATPPSSPTPLKVVATVSSPSRGGASGCISLDPVYRPRPARTTKGSVLGHGVETKQSNATHSMQGQSLLSRALSPSATTTWMSISAPSLPCSSAVTVNIQARVAGSYAAGQSTRLHTGLSLDGGTPLQRRMRQPANHVNDGRGTGTTSGTRAGDKAGGRASQARCSGRHGYTCSINIHDSARTNHLRSRPTATRRPRGESVRQGY